ncbi:unnamed protein product [Scytosiphon promiscuus]
MTETGARQAFAFALHEIRSGWWCCLGTGKGYRSCTLVAARKKPADSVHQGRVLHQWWVHTRVAGLRPARIFSKNCVVGRCQTGLCRRCVCSLMDRQSSRGIFQVSVCRRRVGTGHLKILCTSARGVGGGSVPSERMLSRLWWPTSKRSLVVFFCDPSGGDHVQRFVILRRRSVVFERGMVMAAGCG